MFLYDLLNSNLDSSGSQLLVLVLQFYIKQDEKNYFSFHIMVIIIVPHHLFLEFSLWRTKLIIMLIFFLVVKYF